MVRPSQEGLHLSLVYSAIPCLLVPNITRVWEQALGALGPPSFYKPTCCGSPAITPGMGQDTGLCGACPLPGGFGSGETC